MDDNDIYNRLSILEYRLRELKQNSSPTVPTYNPSSLPQDAVAGQIAVGTDNSFNWFDGSSWHTQAGTPSTVGDVPQDKVDGQIAIGAEGSFHWCVGGIWYTSGFVSSIIGDIPQDSVKGQIAIGSDGSFHWCVDNGIGGSGAGT